MRTAHKGMGLKDEHFNAIVELMGKAFKDNGVDD